MIFLAMTACFDSADSSLTIESSESERAQKHVTNMSSLGSCSWIRSIAEEIIVAPVPIVMLWTVDLE